MNARLERRGGFSLMEMMIATAVLAGSGVALFALVGQASQLARKAEERTVALQMAQSTLDEFLANGSESEDETEGGFESDPRWAYRIEQSDVDAAGQEESRLKRIVVSIYRSSQSGGRSSDTADSAIVRLVRWSRVAKPRPPLSSETSSSDTSSSQSSESMPAASSIPEALRSL